MHYLSQDGISPGDKFGLQARRCLRMLVYVFALTVIAQRLPAGELELLDQGKDKGVD